MNERTRGFGVVAWGLFASHAFEDAESRAFLVSAFGSLAFHKKTYVFLASFSSQVTRGWTSMCAGEKYHARFDLNACSRGKKRVSVSVAMFFFFPENFVFRQI